jgi:mRNA interferase MazF
MGSNDARRGEVWLTAFGANRKGELGKCRPAVVMTVDEITTGEANELLIVIPLSASRAPSPFRIPIPEGEGIDRDCVAVVRSARAVARSRLMERLAVLDLELLEQLTATLVAVVGGSRAGI